MQIFAPTYTQTPNDLFDHWLPLLGDVELKVLLTIIRKTFGWHKKCDHISISQLERATGSTAYNIGNATKSLISKGLISKTLVGPKGKQETYYELIVNEDSNNSYPSRCGSTPPPAVGVPPLPQQEAQKKSPKEIEKQQDDDLTATSSAAKKDDFPIDLHRYTIHLIDGTEMHITADEVFTTAVMRKLDWTSQEIRLALTQVKKSCPQVRDWVKYIDSVIKNIRRDQESEQKKKAKKKKNPIREEKEQPQVEQERTERPAVGRDSDPGKKHAMEYNERLRSSGFEVFEKLAERNDESLKTKYLLVYTKRDAGSFGMEKVGYHNLFVSQWEGINSVFDEILEKKHTQKG